MQPGSGSVRVSITATKQPEDHRIYKKSPGVGTSDPAPSQRTDTKRSALQEGLALEKLAFDYQRSQRQQPRGSCGVPAAGSDQNRADRARCEGETGAYPPEDAGAAQTADTQ